MSDEPAPPPVRKRSGPFSDPKPELATNRAGRTVAESLSGYITHAAEGFVGGARLDIASAYFNVGGHSLLADSLRRLLLGRHDRRTPPGLDAEVVRS